MSDNHDFLGRYLGPINLLWPDAGLKTCLIYIIIVAVASQMINTAYKLNEFNISLTEMT